MRRMFCLSGIANSSSGSESCIIGFPNLGQVVERSARTDEVRHVLDLVDFRGDFFRCGGPVDRTHPALGDAGKHQRETTADRAVQGLGSRALFAREVEHQWRYIV